MAGRSTEANNFQTHGAGISDSEKERPLTMSAETQAAAISFFKECLDHGIPVNFFVDGDNMILFLPPPDALTRPLDLICWVESPMTAEHYFFHKAIPLTAEELGVFLSKLPLPYTGNESEFKTVCEEYEMEFLGNNATNIRTVPTAMIKEAL